MANFKHLEMLYVRWWSFVGVFLICGTVFVSAPLNAQQAFEQKSVELEEIVVTGIKSLSRSSIEHKRNSVGVVDSVSQDTFGLLPDLTAVQVAQRIPGISTVGATGVTNDRSGDNAESIVIRGIDSSFNIVTLDRVPIAVASEAIAGGASRSATIELIPPSAIGRFEIAKTLGADQIAQALSGQLNLVSRSAFDSGRSLSTRLAVGDNSTSGEWLDNQDPNSRAEITYTDIFGQNEQFGIVAALSYQNFYSTNFEEKPGAIGNAYRFYKPGGNGAPGAETNIIADSNGFPAARRNQFFIFENQRERISGNVKLEFQPNDDTYASIYAGYFIEDEDERRWEQWVGGYPSNIAPDNQTATTGTWTDGGVQYGSVFQPQKRETFMVTGAFDHQLGDTSRISSRLSYSEAISDLPRVMSAFFLRDPGYAFSYDTSSERPVVSFTDPAFAADPNSNTESYIRDRQFDSKQKVLYFDLKYGDNFQGFDNGWGYQVGIAYTDRNQFFNQDYEQGRVDNTTIEIDDFLIGTTSGYDPANVPFFLTDPLAHLAAWNAAGRPITSDRSDNSLQDDFDLGEEIIAPFAQFSYRGEKFLLTGGVRYENADIAVDNFVRELSLPKITEDADQFVPASLSSDYDLLLPSLLLTYNISDDIVLRTAYGRTLGRPDYEHYATQESIGAPDVPNGTISITRGNHNIEPRISDNYDLSLEYYFDDGASQLSAALFYKDIQDMIFVTTEEVPDFVVDGAPYLATISQSTNLSDAFVWGLELSFVKDFATTLPAPWDALLLRGNITFLEGELKIPTLDNLSGIRSTDGFLNQPETIANFSIGYDTDRFGFQVAYNWTDEYKVTLDTNYAYRDVIQEARGQLDAQLRIRVSDSWTIIAEGQNLTEEERLSERPFGLVAQDTEVGRILWLGVGWSLDM